MGTTKRELAKFIGEKIKLIRTAARLSQTKLAQKTGISQNFLSNIENGTVSLDVYDFFLIANALHMRPEDFCPPAVLEQFSSWELITKWEDNGWEYVTQKRKKSEE